MRLTLISGVHVISLFTEGEIILEALATLNFFPAMNEVKDKLVHLYTAGMIRAITQVTTPHKEYNHVGML